MSLRSYEGRDHLLAQGLDLLTSSGRSKVHTTNNLPKRKVSAKILSVSSTPLTEITCALTRANSCCVLYSCFSHPSHPFLCTPCISMSPPEFRLPTIRDSLFPFSTWQQRVNDLHPWLPYSPSTYIFVLALQKCNFSD